jgi:hypothetical protein
MRLEPVETQIPLPLPASPLLMICVNSTRMPTLHA